MALVAPRAELPSHAPVKAPMDWRSTIKQYRQRNGLKQQALASILGCDQTAISQWERGLSNPSLAYQRRLIRMLAEDERGREDLRLVESVERSPGFTVLFDTQLRVLAGSPRFWEIYETTGPKDPDVFLDFGSDENHRLVASAFSDIDSALVFEGEINLRPADGKSRARMAAVAAPVHLSDNSYALRVELELVESADTRPGALTKLPFQD